MIIMKKYINSEIKRIDKQLKKGYSDSLNKTKEELINLLNEDNNSETYYENTDIKEHYKFMKEIIQIVSKMKILDSELPIDYPTLISRPRISPEAIIDFLNSIYEDELPEDMRLYYTVKNIRVFKNSLLNRILNNGKCKIYNNYSTGESTILLKKYSNIRDFIKPVEKSTDLINSINDEMPQLKNELMRNYMVNRSINILGRTEYHQDSIQYELIKYDNRILNARLIEKLILKYPPEELDNEQLYYIIEFYFEIISQILADNDNVTLYDIYRTPYSNNIKEYTEYLKMNDNDVINGIKIYSNKIKNYIE